MSSNHFSSLQSLWHAKPAFVLVVLGCLTLVGWAIHEKPRTWSLHEVPIAFWSWRTQTPASADVENAIQKIGARSLFLRAGQIAYGDGAPHRVRAVAGPLPKNVDLHLVYNATPSLLQQLDTLSDRAFVNAIAIAYHEDAQRAAQQKCRVVGVQLDIDVPTRLLSRYARVLSMLRADLAKGTTLSITGLPSWMDSYDLADVLTRVDFWIPQFYGGQIPERLNDLVPISNSAAIKRRVRQAAALDKPFYAGLAAYGCAFLYGSDGSLVSLHGDIDPIIVAVDPNLELVDSRSVAESEQPPESAAEYRYAFHVRADGVTDRLAVHKDDVLVIYVPTAESLRIASRIVREYAGRRLLGICLFRLPAEDDQTNLSLSQVSSALADRDSTSSIEIRVSAQPSKTTGEKCWFVEVENTGTTTAQIDQLKIDLTLPASYFKGLVATPAINFETLCAESGVSSAPEPCPAQRTNVLRLQPRYLPAGKSVSAVLVTSRELPSALPVSVEMQTEEGRRHSVQQLIFVEK